MADALKAQGVILDELYFPPDYEPKLPHEYQFNLDTEAGQTAMTHMVAFLRNRSI